MKTTIDIADPLLLQAKRLAARRGTTLKELVEQGLRRVLADKSSSPPFVFKPVTYKGNGLTAEVRGASWERIRDIIYEGRGT